MLSTQRRFVPSDKMPEEIFPDQVTETCEAARQVVLNHWGGDQEAVADTSHRFTLSEARDMVISSYAAFSPEMGVRAQAIFDAGFENAPDIEPVDFETGESSPLSSDPSRWRIRSIPPNAGRSIMRSVPANAQRSEYMPENPHNHAVIQYEFDGTLNGVIYMAHEVGHAIADDMQDDNTLNPGHLTETQAYFGQHVAYSYLSSHENRDIASMAAAHSNTLLKDAFSNITDVDYRDQRPLPIIASRVLFDRLQDADPEMRSRVVGVLMGAEGPKDISEVMAIAGIERPAELLRDFLSMSPLQAGAQTNPDVDQGAGVKGQALTSGVSPS